MVPVRVSVAIGKRTVPLEEVTDKRVIGALREAARNVGLRLAKAVCPTHGKGPTDVRLHFDSAGNGDLKYESCCELLGKEISKLV
jgi:hypothetical protein